MVSLQSRGYFVRMNHACLLTAIMLHCGIPQELHHDVCLILADAKVSFHGYFVCIATLRSTIDIEISKKTGKKLMPKYINFEKLCIVETQ